MSTRITFLASIHLNLNRTPCYIQVLLDVKRNYFYENVLNVQDVCVPNETEGLLKHRT